jgi:hypothetical protein
MITWFKTNAESLSAPWWWHFQWQRTSLLNVRNRRLRRTESLCLLSLCIRLIILVIFGLL